MLLERGAGTVYAVDVGHGQIAPGLRDDSRVVVEEGVNVRDLTLEHVGGAPVGLVVADLSFISLRLVLERLLSVLEYGGAALVLVKPQFEVGRGHLGSHGVVVDDAAGRRAVTGIVRLADRLGWGLAWSAPSRVPGERGNQEVFCLFKENLPEENLQRAL